MKIENPIESDYCLLFPGQGAHDLVMLESAATSSSFKSHYKIVCDVINSDPLSEIKNKNIDYLNRNLISSVLVALVSVLSLEAFLAKQSKLPTFVTGYSVGQWTSLYAANAITFEQLIQTVAIRANCMDQSIKDVASGMMAVIGVAEHKLVELCNSMQQKGYFITISNFNCPGQYSISGTAEALDVALLEIDKLQPKKMQRLPVAGAWHCSLLNSAAVEFQNYLSTMTLKKPTIPIVDNVTGDFLPMEKTPMMDQLTKHLFSPVLWEKGIRLLIQNNCKCFIEIGYGETLRKFGLFIDREVQHLSFC